MSAATLEATTDSGPEVRSWTAEDYQRAADAGVFGPEERLELVNGAIYRMSPQNASHTTVVGLIDDALSEVFRTGHCVRIQMPLEVGGNSLPEPDVCVVAGSRRDYLRRHPSEASLLVEVADTSVAFDLITKSALYASAGIPEYWVAVIPERVLVVHREPDTSTGAYRSIVRLRDGESVSPLAAPDAKLAVTDLLP